MINAYIYKSQQMTLRALALNRHFSVLSDNVPHTDVPGHTSDLGRKRSHLQQQQQQEISYADGHFSAHNSAYDKRFRPVPTVPVCFSTVSGTLAAAVTAQQDNSRDCTHAAGVLAKRAAGAYSLSVTAEAL